MSHVAVASAPLAVVKPARHPNRTLSRTKWRSRGEASRQVAMVMASTASYGFDSVDVGAVFYVYVGVFAN